MPEMDSVCLGLWARTGSRYEDDPALNGVSHFIEHLLFKGTTHRNALQLSVDIEGIGGTSNAFTAEENTCFFARSRASHLEILMDVLMDMYCNSTFPPSEIRKEREVICEEIAMTYDQPSQYVQELLNTLQWANHPLGRPITGTEKGIHKINRKNILDYFHKHYVGKNTWIIAAGKVDHQQLTQLALQYSQSLAVGEANNYLPFQSKQQKPHILCRKRASDQTQFALGIRTFPRSFDKLYALRVISTLIGENSSSLLFQSIREKRGLAYSIGSSMSAFYDAGDLVISAGVDGDKVEKTLKLILQELKHTLVRPFSEKAMRHAQDYVVGQMELNLENTENQMIWLGEQLLAGTLFLTPEEIKTRISQTTAAEVQSILRQVLIPERINLAIIGAPQNKAALEKILLTNIG